MLLAVDVGNTQTVMGLYGPGDGPGGSSGELLCQLCLNGVARGLQTDLVRKRKYLAWRSVMNGAAVFS